MTRSAAIAAAYMIAVTQGCAMLRDGKTYGPADYLRPRHAAATSASCWRTFSAYASVA